MKNSDEKGCPLGWDDAEMRVPRRSSMFRKPIRIGIAIALSFAFTASILYLNYENDRIAPSSVSSEHLHIPWEVLGGDSFADSEVGGPPGFPHREPHGHHRFLNGKPAERIFL